MRPDFNKLLVERERPRSWMKFGYTRNSKTLNASTDQLGIGGRESMRKRHKISGDYKVFNENLNPLKSWIHSQLGKKWDKSYSELRRTFDSRGVINGHILQHLFDYIEIHTKLVDDVVMVLDNSYGSRGYVPLKKLSNSSYRQDYYVCPKDGTVKSMVKQPRRSVIKQQEADVQRKKDATFRDLGAKHLHLEDDGNWYIYDVVALPPVVKEFARPNVPKDYLFVVGAKYQLNKKEKLWEELNEAERRTHGVLRIVSGDVLDARTNMRTHGEASARGYQSTRNNGTYSYGQPTAGRDKYYSTKQQASHKVLKQAGIDGSATYDEDKQARMSHREASKYR